MNIKNILKFIVIFTFFIVAVLFVMFKFDVGVDQMPPSKVVPTSYTQTAILAGIPLKVEFATTKSQQSQGLSGRNSIADDEAMLFIFDHNDKYKFWMKDMNFSIDMIWFDEAKKVVFIERNATPVSYPGLFGPEEDTRYVLEVTTGFSDQHNLKLGDSLEF